eukprot:5550735-Amphidinium_carterae.1
MAGLGQTPSTRHYWWRACYTCLRLCRDQLNIAEISAFEVLARRWQLWEEIYGAELAETDAGQGTDGKTSERETFLGSARGRSSALVMPELEEYVAKRFEAQLFFRNLYSRKGGRLGRRKHFSGARLPLRQEVIQAVSIPSASIRP